MLALDGNVEPEALLAALGRAPFGRPACRPTRPRRLRDLATKALDGTVVLDPRGLRRESDEEVIARLTAVRGIGEWTAHMFLIFQLRRLDVWPTGDLGVRRGYGLAWGIPTPTAEGARSARRRAAPLPVRGGVVLLAGRGDLRPGRRTAPSPGEPDEKDAAGGAPHRVARPRTPCTWPSWKAPRDPSITGWRWWSARPSSPRAVEVLEADGYLLGSPVNLGYLSGALKHFFDQIYYPCLDATRRRPFGVYLHANNDATGALRALDAIVTGLQWQAAQAPLVVTGDPGPPTSTPPGSSAAPWPPG